MFFDTSLCIGILALLPLIISSVLVSGYHLHQWVTTERGKRFAHWNTVERIVGSIIMIIWIISPFIIAHSGILNHSHSWKWYVGCMLCGLVGSFVIACTPFSKVRAQIMKEPIIPISLLLFLSGGIALIAHS